MDEAGTGSSPTQDPAAGPDPPAGPPDARARTRAVLSVGGASFFSDSSHEMVTSLLPGFVSATLHSGPGALGVIDGVADALTGLAKLAGGPLAADPRRRARLASSGYLGTAVATCLIGVTTAVWQVAGLRALAWVSRGLRSPARDVVLTDVADPGGYGRAFGIERAGDNAGAVAGPLLAAGLVTLIGMRWSILFSIVPGVLAAVAITAAARAARRLAGDTRQRARLSLRLRELRAAGAARVLAPAAAFECGNLAATLLILRATGLLHGPTRTATAAASLAVLLYAAHNAVAAGASLGAGRLVDRWNPRLLLAAGGGFYAASYLVFAGGPRTGLGVLAGFLLAGAGIGCGETAESSMVAIGFPALLRPQAMGLLGLVQAAGDLVATLVAGFLWARFGAATAFGYAAAWMLLSILLWPASRPGRPTQQGEVT